MKNSSFLDVLPVYADANQAKHSNKNGFLSMIKLMALITLCLEISACFPYPHRLTRTPETYLTVVDGQQPVSDTKVYISHSSENKNMCRDAIYIGMTNDKGFLHIKNKSEWNLFYSFINPPELILSSNNICLEMQKSMLFGFNLVEKAVKPLRVELRCDLQKPKTESSLLSAFGFSCEKKYKE